MIAKTMLNVGTRSAYLPRILLQLETMFSGCDRYKPKALTYVEYRAVSGVFQNIDHPPPFRPASVSSPPPASKAGVHTRVVT